MPLTSLFFVKSETVKGGRSDPMDGMINTSFPSGVEIG